jgi:hypothetical protein
MLKCHMRLQELYAQLRDEDSEEAAHRRVNARDGTILQFLRSSIRSAWRFAAGAELFAYFSRKVGFLISSLNNTHIDLFRCLHDYLTERANKICPKCQCKAILMDNISIPSASLFHSVDQQKQIPQSQQIRKSSLTDLLDNRSSLTNTRRTMSVSTTSAATVRRQDRLLASTSKVANDNRSINCNEQSSSHQTAHAKPCCSKDDFSLSQSLMQLPYDNQQKLKSALEQPKNLLDESLLGPDSAVLVCSRSLTVTDV